MRFGLPENLDGLFHQVTLSIVFLYCDGLLRHITKITSMSKPKDAKRIRKGFLPMFSPMCSFERTTGVLRGEKWKQQKGCWRSVRGSQGLSTFRTPAQWLL